MLIVDRCQKPGLLTVGRKESFCVFFDVEQIQFLKISLYVENVVSLCRCKRQFLGVFDVEKDKLNVVVLN